MARRPRALKRESKVCCVILAILALICLIPMIMILSTSFTSENYIQQHGYPLLPKEFTLDTYDFLLSSKGVMLAKAFLLTVAVTVLGMFYQVTISTLFAYAVTQPKEVFRFTRILSFLAWFTTIFSGGIVPWYILCTRYYGLKDNIFALFIPYGFSVFNMFIVRSGFRGIPKEIIEAARIDGASNSRVLVSIALPLARGSILTIALFAIFQFWNDFHLARWLTVKSDFMTLQKLLYGMLTDMSALLQQTGLLDVIDKINLPTQTAKMAVAVITILPLVIIYPLSLKYFVKGINLGGVKG